MSTSHPSIALDSPAAASAAARRRWGKAIFGLFCAALIGIWMPGSAHAQAMGMEGWVSGQNQLLAEIAFYEKLQGTTLMTEVVPKTIDTIKSINAVAGTVRDAYELEQTIANYTSEQLLNDVLNGLVRAFPEVGELMEEIDYLRENITGARKGGNAFFATKNKWDRKTWDFFTTYTEKFEQSVIFPSVAPKSTEKYKWKESDPYSAYYSALVDSGMLKEFRTDAFSKAVMLEFAQKYDTMAESRHNLQAQIASKNLATNLQTSYGVKTLERNAILDMANKGEAKNAKEQLDAERLKTYQDAEKEGSLPDLFQEQIKIQVKDKPAQGTDYDDLSGFMK